jgi:hypothetical protein
MSKGLITFIAIVCISFLAAGFIYFMKQSADDSRKRSDTILEQFKTVDQDLQESNQKLDSLNKIYFDSLRKADK